MNTFKQNILGSSIQFIKGVGPKLSMLLKKKGIDSVEDAFYYLPRNYEDRSRIKTISEVVPLEYSLIKGEILNMDVIKIKNSKRRIFVMDIGDNTGRISCKWFNFNERYLKKLFYPGAKVIVSGTSSLYGGRIELHHPDLELVDEGLIEENIHFGRIVPIYSETEGLGQKTIRKILYNIVKEHVSAFNDCIPREIINRLDLPDLITSLQEVHFPSLGADVELFRAFQTKFQKRLIFDEFFIMELALALRRKKIKKKEGIAFSIKDEWLAFIDDKLPFELTHAQKRVIAETFIDMQKHEPMNRLIQGDVGSGKTIVAFYCAMMTVLNGYQVAMMVPTEILAEQHYKGFKKIFGDDIRISLLTSSVGKKEKTLIKEEIEKGCIAFVIGTHALIQDDVSFSNLGLVIVDEQHRFGVEQRFNLVKKGIPDILVMTATPIPRTLAMTVYGDLDISVINEKPAGRKAIVTKLVYENKRKTVYDFVRNELKAGRQAYFVYPLVEQSDKLMLKDAKDAALKLSKVFPEFKVGLIHGKMKSEEKDDVMRQFKNCELQVLVSTTVIEVGIDVPNANIMFIEHPERFGLSQLHQLRGRVGRGDTRSLCILMASYRLSEQAKKRLQVMCSTDDGFKIAEEDLIIRGPGEFLGTRQHGLPGFRIGNLLRDIEILIHARNEALRLVETDPELQATPNLKLKSLLNRKFKGHVDFMPV